MIFCSQTFIRILQEKFPIYKRRNFKKRRSWRNNPGNKIMKIMKDNIKNIEESTIPPYKCKVCGMGNIEQSYDICQFCGWEDDDIQNEKPDYMGGANEMSLNQYKKFWEENKDEILKADNTCFKAIDLAKKYYEINYKNHKLN